MNRIQIIIATLSLGLSSAAHAQFVSGSNGSDGALTIGPNLGAIPFDGTGLDVDGDGVFHFTTIDIGANTTVLLRADNPAFNEGVPVVWLASGAVNITGTLDLQGGTGHRFDGVATGSIPGAGGFAGGRGGQVGNDFPHGGSGPGGGLAAATMEGGHASHRTVGPTGATRAAPGVAYGNRFLFPLLGGSGGGGSGVRSNGNGAGGGAGGGAILIASSVSITFGAFSAITVMGGARGVQSSGSSGGGAGGAIRLMAPNIAAAGTLEARGRDGGGAGFIRVEGAVVTGNFSLSPLDSFSNSTPTQVFPPATTPTVRVTQVGGVAVTMTPTGSFVMPDVTLTAAAPVMINLAAENIPLGTTVSVRMTSDLGQTMTFMSSPLAGAVANSTATVGPVTLPAGFSRFHVFATW